MSHYLVTGGLGFIGNELVRQLRASGADASILDSASRRAPHITDLADVSHFEVDLCDRTATFRVVKAAKPQVVFHLAGIHFIPECNGAPDQTARTNIEGTINLLDACAHYKVRHFIFASSGAVYADSACPLREDSPIAPVDIYGWSKWFGEELCRHYSSSSMAQTVARLFNTFGPRETNAHLIPEILQQLRFGDSISLGNTVSQRDYIYVADCAAALVRLGQTSKSHGRTVNIGTGRSASAAQIVAMLGSILDRDLRIVLDAQRLRGADKHIQIADISLLDQMLNWVPLTSLEQGLRELLTFEGLLKKGRLSPTSYNLKEEVVAC